MRLADLLAPQRVVVPLPVATLDAAMRVLVEACVADGRVADPVRLERDIRESWPEDTVSIGPHAWLPHFRTEAVAAPVAALGIAPEPLPGRDPEAPGLRLVLLVLAPPREAAAYLQIVAAFARALARPEVAAGLLAARSGAEVLALPALREIELPGQLLVRDLMATPAPALGPDQPIAEAAALLGRLGMDALPVVSEGGEVLGMLSHRELLRYLAPLYLQRATTGEGPVGGPPEPRRIPVRDVMARSVLCVSEDQPLAEVAHLLAGREVGQVPVVKDGVLRGFLSRAEIVRRVMGTV